MPARPGSRITTQNRPPELSVLACCGSKTPFSDVHFRIFLRRMFSERKTTLFKTTFLPAGNLTVMQAVSHQSILSITE
jgi:hypothetical protein